MLASTREAQSTRVRGFPLGGSCQRPRPLTDEGEPSAITRQRVAAVTLPLIRPCGATAPPPYRGEAAPQGKAFSLKKLYHTNRVRYNLQY